MTVLERMAQAIADLRTKWPTRHPKAFYLNEADHAEFLATDPPTVRAPWGNNPTVYLDEPAFEGVPVRASEAKVSRLYNSSCGGRELPS